MAKQIRNLTPNKQYLTIKMDPKYAFTAKINPFSSIVLKDAEYLNVQTPNSLNNALIFTISEVDDGIIDSRQEVLNIMDQNKLKGSFLVGATHGIIEAVFGNITVEALNVAGTYLVKPADTSLIGRQIIDAHGSIGIGASDRSDVSLALPGPGAKIDSNYVHSGLGEVVVRSIHTETPYTPFHIAGAMITVTIEFASL